MAVSGKIKGMSIVELVVVMAIVVLITGLGISSVERVSFRQVEADAQKVMSELRATREMALNGQADYCVEFQTDALLVYENICGVAAGFLGREQLEGAVVQPAPPWEMTFLSPRQSPFRAGGTMTSPQSAAGELVIRLQKGSQTQDIRVFEQTGFFKME